MNILDSRGEFAFQYKGWFDIWFRRFYFYWFKLLFFLGKTPAHLACSHGNTKSLQEVLRKGVVSIFSLYHWSLSTFIWSSIINYSTSFIQLFKKILQSTLTKLYRIESLCEAFRWILYLWSFQGKVPLPLSGASRYPQISTPCWTVRIPVARCIYLILWFSWILNYVIRCFCFFQCVGSWYSRFNGLGANSYCSIPRAIRMSTGIWLTSTFFNIIINIWHPMKIFKILFLLFWSIFVPFLSCLNLLELNWFLFFCF